jgi:DNA polymerase III subunit gamma/tau
MAAADDMATRSLSFSNALQDLGTLLNRIAIAQMVPAAIPDELPEREDVLRLAAFFSPEDIQLCYQIVVHGRHDLGLAPDEYAGFTMTLLRMLAFSPLSSSGTSGASGALGAQSATAAMTRPAAARSSATTAPATTPPSMSGRPLDKSESPDKKNISPAMAALAAARSSKAVSKVPLPPDDFSSEPAEAIPVQASTDTAQKKTEPLAQTVSSPAAASMMDWPALVRQLPLKGVVQQLATQSELRACEEKDQILVITLRVPVETLLSAGSADKLAAALGKHFGKTVQLVSDIGTVTHTAHAKSVADQARRQAQAEQTLNDDPFVQTLMREFGATIVPGSIKPV